ncbi:hypothetical protein B7P43_G02549, partial [Cryptotermes secundus]
VTTEAYLNIFNEFVNQLTDDELTESYFQQDGATCHTSNASMRKTENPGSNPGRRGWKPATNRLSYSTAFLVELLKDRVYSNKPRTFDAFKDAIRQKGATITDVALPDVFDNLQTRIQKCLNAVGGHFQHML